MSALTVFELAQKEAEEKVWIPTKAARFISQLLSRKFKKQKATLATEQDRRQTKSSQVRIITQLRSTSRRRHVAIQSNPPSKIVRAKRSGSSRCPTRASARSAPNK
jgi:hypothetical protein